MQNIRHVIAALNLRVTLLVPSDPTDAYHVITNLSFIYITSIKIILLVKGLGDVHKICHTKEL